MKKPLIPEQGDDPPEIPHQGFAVRESFGQFTHVVVAQGPMAKVGVVEDPVEDGREQQHADGAEEEAAPTVEVGARGHVIEIVMPDEEGDEGETGDFG